MSCWASNATWLEPQGSESAQKGVKRARHVAMGLQRDVARAPRVRIRPKGSKTSAPRRIGSAPCRDGPPIRRGTSSKGPNPPEREQNECATSHWECAMSHWEVAMSCWASNATWLEPKGAETPQKGVKRALHVALEVRHVAMGLQYDVARAPRVQIPSKGSKTSAPRRIGTPPCRIGPLTRRGSSPEGPNPLEREQNERSTSHWDPAMSYWASNTTWLEFQGSKSLKKRVKRARHVALGACHVAMDLQRDMAPTR